MKSRLSLRPFSPEEMMGVFSDAIEQALHDGFTGFRAAGDKASARAAVQALGLAMQDPAEPTASASSDDAPF